MIHQCAKVRPPTSALRTICCGVSCIGVSGSLGGGDGRALGGAIWPRSAEPGPGTESPDPPPWLSGRSRVGGLGICGRNEGLFRHGICKAGGIEWCFLELSLLRKR